MAQVAYKSGLPEKAGGENRILTTNDSGSEKDSTGKKEPNEKMTISGFDPKQSDELLALIQKKSYPELHGKGASDYKKDVPLVNLTRYLNYCFELVLRDAS